MADAAEQFARFKTLIATPEPPALGPQRRSGTLGIQELTYKFTTFFERENISPALQPFLKSAALLWHDHLDASHEISQNIHTPEGSWLHGIMHRREPDYENAKYWFQRVGNHEAYLLLTERAARNEELLKAGQWDSFAFIDAGEKAAKGDDPVAVSILQQVQVTEFEVLVAYVFQHA